MDDAERFIGDLGLGVIFIAWKTANDERRTELLEDAVAAICPITHVTTTGREN